ncbi:MAG: hypothetical protein MUP45_02215 [Candidatus Marinimicrobia bacterium]|nr:hypothetical protein [Candidatus Neomarinimicrobiota bacterium]
MENLVTNLTLIDLIVIFSFVLFGLSLIILLGSLVSRARTIPFLAVISIILFSMNLSADLLFSRWLSAVPMAMALSVWVFLLLRSFYQSILRGTCERYHFNCRESFKKGNEQAQARAREKLEQVHKKLPCPCELTFTVFC